MAADLKKDNSQLVRHLPTYEVSVKGKEGCSPLARRSELLLMVWKIQEFKVLRLINPNVQIPGHRATSFPTEARYWLRRYTETAFGLCGSSSSTVSSSAWFLALSAWWLQETNNQSNVLKEAFHSVPVLIVGWLGYAIFFLPLPNFQRSWQKPDNSLDSYHYHWPYIIQVPQLPVHSVPHIPHVPHPHPPQIRITVNGLMLLSKVVTILLTTSNGMSSTAPWPRESAFQVHFLISILSLGPQESRAWDNCLDASNLFGMWPQLE